MTPPPPKDVTIFKMIFYYLFFIYLYTEYYCALQIDCDFDFFNYNNKLCLCKICQNYVI